MYLWSVFWLISESLSRLDIDFAKDLHPNINKKS
jgi:hypothetical protein